MADSKQRLRDEMLCKVPPHLHDRFVTGSVDVSPQTLGLSLGQLYFSPQKQEVDESGANWHHNLHVQLAISQRSMPCTHDRAISTENNAHKVGTLPIRLHKGTSCKTIHISTVCKGHMKANEYDM